MEREFVKVPVSELQFGMFICELDKPWLDTPFMIQGFLLEHDSQRKVLNEQCLYVVVDKGKSKRRAFAKRERLSLGKTLEQTFPTRKLKTYQDVTSFEDELKSAKDIYRNYEETVSRIYDQYNSSRKIDLKAANEAVGNIVSSIIRNPDACNLLQQMKRKGDYLYNHAIGTSIWAASMARQIGLPETDIRTAAMGGLLCDIGKVSLSRRILEKPEKLDSSELALIKTHVLTDEKFEEEHPGLSQKVLSIIRSHHERHDGSGYPDGLKGNAVPVFARIVGLADTYDAMTNHRSYARAKTPDKAIKELYEQRDFKFQAEIVEEFIQATGVYPVGTLVELNSGEVGIVIAEYRSRRMRPKLLIVLEQDKAPPTKPYYLDLSEQPQETHFISKSLEPGAYGLDSDDFFI